MTEWQTPKGTFDILPEEMARRRAVYAKIRAVYASYGYEEVSTPAFEDFELLAKKSGPAIEQEIYAFTDKAGRKLGLRFDPTVPICRIIASNPSLPKPIKYCYITNMWRYDNPGAGRYREFWQAGVELIGSKSPDADAEILKLVAEILDAVGVKNYEFKINSRKITETAIRKTGINEEKITQAFRSLDKLSKIGEKNVFKEMTAAGIKKEQAEQLLAFVKNNKVEKQELVEIEEIKKRAEELGVKNISIDLSLVRGIDYYTGFVFEAIVTGAKGGSVAGGGRYDSLIGLYGKNDLPAVGFGMGLERILELVENPKTYSSVMVFVANAKEETRQQAKQTCLLLRKAGVSSEFDLMQRDLKKQFDYCNSKKIPYCLIIGPKEVEEKNVTLRDMRSGKEQKVKQTELAGVLKKLEF